MRLITMAAGATCACNVRWPVQVCQWCGGARNCGINQLTHLTSAVDTAAWVGISERLERYTSRGGRTIEAMNNCKHLLV